MLSDMGVLTSAPARTVPAHVVYRIDADDVIVETGGDWDKTACANDAEELTRGVVGTSLLAAVSDSTLRQLWAQILERARGGQVREPLSLRCDAPAVRRWLHLELVADEEGGVTFASTLVRQEPRDVVSLLDRRVARRPDVLLRVCAWCGQVELGRSWLAPEAAVSLLGIGPEAPLPQITHGICGTCHRAVSALFTGT